MSIREPAVAGQFYQGQASRLRAEVEASFLGPGGPGQLPKPVKPGVRRIAALVSPHAGLIYSGSTAACGYYRLAEDGLPDTVVIIGPNHRSFYPAVALSNDTAWRTPLGTVSLDIDVVREIASVYPDAEVSLPAHYAEHSLEVQLPFLQYIAQAADTKLKIVPVLIGGAAMSTPEREADLAYELGNVIASALSGRDAVVIASTDFSHYESSESARSKDSQAIEQILRLDERGLLDTVADLDISMCGALPTAITISASKKHGAVSATRLTYRNSGDVTGDYREVVGYASIEIDRQE
ncbi:MAG: AmmeMemoRadiSam system protein B [Armatimonadota bacterium]